MASRFRVVALGVVGIVVVALAGVAIAAPRVLNDWPYAGKSTQTGSYTFATVGDIACEPDDPENSGTPAQLKCGSDSLGGRTAEYATAGQAYAMHPAAVALLGDEQYQVGKLSDFEQSFEQAWGGLKMLERPAPGNHEYYPYTKKGDNEAAQNGAGYFGYFNGHDQDGQPNAQGQAGDDTDENQGWYSYNLGDWHIVSLNIECDSAPFKNDCSTTDGGLLAKETHWLADDLAANNQPCTIAYWHQPTFTAADTSADVPDPNAPGADSTEGLAADAWWKLLYKNHATLVLNGHEHYYARYRPMDPAGHSDPKHGITQFTIGTGGEALDTLAKENGTYSNSNVVTAQDQAFGVMKLSLNPHSYSWNYRPVLAGPGADPTSVNYHDSGTAACRG
ncbi:MAG TPA: metallophosphoesterase [Mycobacteriales bacterium]|nr:metallophosphoesterase [Mycobacteriales bacterium]